MLAIGIYIDNENCKANNNKFYIYVDFNLLKRNRRKSFNIYFFHLLSFVKMIAKYHNNGIVTSKLLSIGAQDKRAELLRTRYILGCSPCCD